MQTRTKQGLQTLRKAHAFLATRAYSAAMGELKPQVEALSAIVQRIEERAGEQGASDSASRAATEAKRSLASELRLEYLRPISRIAIKLFADNPELRKSFMVRPPRDAEGLIAMATAYVERATQFKDRFVEKGLAPDFVERLKQARETFREALVTRGLEQARRSSATVALVEEVARGRAQVRLIDAMLAPRLASRPEQLAEWRSITRFVRSAPVETVDTGAGTPTGPTTPPVSSPPLPSQPAPATEVAAETKPQVKAA